MKSFHSVIKRLFSKRKKYEKRVYGRERYKYLTEGEKQRLLKYRKNILKYELLHK